MASYGRRKIKIDVEKVTPQNVISVLDRVLPIHSQNSKVVLPCSANNTYEAPDSSIAKGAKYTLNDEFYLASAREIFNTNWDVADDSKVFPFYEGAGNADRIKYRDGSAAYWWLRTPSSGDAHGVRLVSSDGTMRGTNALNALGLAPACTIV